MITVNIRPDNRSQLVGTFTFQDTAATPATVTVTLNGHINYDTGVVLFQAVCAGGTSGWTYACSHADFNFRFVPYATMNGRTQVEIETSMQDVAIDPNEDKIRLFS